MTLISFESKYSFLLNFFKDLVKFSRVKAQKEKAKQNKNKKSKKKTTKKQKKQMCLIEMKTIFLNTETSKSSEPHKFVLNLPQRLDLKRSEKHVALQNLCI